MMDTYDDDDEIAYFTVRWKTRASFVYRAEMEETGSRSFAQWVFAVRAMLTQY